VENDFFPPSGFPPVKNYPNFAILVSRVESIVRKVPQIVNKEKLSFVKNRIIFLKIKCRKKKNGRPRTFHQKNYIKQFSALPESTPPSEPSYDSNKKIENPY